MVRITRRHHPIVCLSGMQINIEVDILMRANKEKL